MKAPRLILAAITVLILVFFIICLTQWIYFQQDPGESGFAPLVRVNRYTHKVEYFYFRELGDGWQWRKYKRK